MQEQNAEMVLLKPTLEVCKNAKKRGLNNAVCGALSENDVFDNAIPQAMLLDVLEHIENDEDFLRLLYKKLEPDGKVLITVPAFKCLWSNEDVSAGHFRRYRDKQLKNVAEKCGFRRICLMPHYCICRYESCVDARRGKVRYTPQ